MYLLVHQAVFVVAFEIGADAAIEDVIGVLERVIVDQPVQF